MMDTPQPLSSSSSCLSSVIDLINKRKRKLAEESPVFNITVTNNKKNQKISIEVSYLAPLSKLIELLKDELPYGTDVMNISLPEYNNLELNDQQQSTTPLYELGLFNNTTIHVKVRDIPLKRARRSQSVGPIGLFNKQEVINKIVLNTEVRFNERRLSLYRSTSQIDDSYKMEYLESGSYSNSPIDPSNFASPHKETLSPTRKLPQGGSLYDPPTVDYHSAPSAFQSSNPKKSEELNFTETSKVQSTMTEKQPSLQELDTLPFNSEDSNSTHSSSGLFPSSIEQSDNFSQDPDYIESVRTERQTSPGALGASNVNVGSLTQKGVESSIAKESLGQQSDGVPSTHQANIAMTDEEEPRTTQTEQSISINRPKVLIDLDEDESMTNPEKTSVDERATTKQVDEEDEELQGTPSEYSIAKLPSPLKKPEQQKFKFKFSSFPDHTLELSPNDSFRSLKDYYATLSGIQLEENQHIKLIFNGKKILFSRDTPRTIDGDLSDVNLITASVEIKRIKVKIICESHNRTTTYQIKTGLALNKAFQKFAKRLNVPRSKVKYYYKNILVGDRVKIEDLGMSWFEDTPDNYFETVKAVVITDR